MRRLGAKAVFNVSQTLHLSSPFPSSSNSLQGLRAENFSIEIPAQYRDPNIVRKIKDATDDSVHIVLDAYSEEESQLICIKAFGPGGGRLMLVQHEAPYIRRLRKDVTVQCT